jgi:hypothetical protein
VSEHVKVCPCPECSPPGYASLQSVLRRALEQAAHGKGKERHASVGVPFVEQPIVTEGIEQGGNGFQIGQARKKALESMRLPKERAVAELLGAINYLAAAVVLVEMEGHAAAALKFKAAAALAEVGKKKE